MALRGTSLIVASVIVISSLCLSQQTTVEKVPIRHTSPGSAKEMYTAYCAACHGKDGKGDGPAASALKVAPPDLTTLAKRNNGVFPRDHVYGTITGQVPIAAHGSKDMPVWGTLFRSIDSADSFTMMRLKNLTDYIESLQAKK
jgi:mono/diheme cytochrome c family protein